MGTLWATWQLPRAEQLAPKPEAVEYPRAPPRYKLTPMPGPSKKNGLPAVSK